MDFEKVHYNYKEHFISGRYITLDSIIPLFDKLKLKSKMECIGHSVLNRPIYKFQIGTGKKRILMWSQMHGNESTTTKAVFDFLNLLNDSTELSLKLLNNFTFCILPMLNPDGAALYTRNNANNIDLNRDSQALTQPESKLLRSAFESFKPDYCFNLHDQRTIFGTEIYNKSATISFLSPSYNEERTINEVRLKSINVIVAMNTVLQQYIPGQIGRFDDSFNINCTGDTFQSLNIPTILFEAGHYPNDYEREITRKYIFIALLSGLLFINKDDIVCNETTLYLNIPQNNIIFYDMIYRNINIYYDSTNIITNFALQYKEELINNKINFNAYFKEIGNLDDFYGHFEYDAKGATYSDGLNNFPIIDQKADFCLNGNVKIVNGILNI